MGKMGFGLGWDLIHGGRLFISPARKSAVN
jgi:hypothetical protein